MRIFYLFFIFILVAELSGQNQETQEADDLYAAGRYGAAYPLYADLVKKYPENAIFNYKAGLCLLTSRSLKTKAAPYLLKAISRTGSSGASDKTANAPPIVYRQLAEAYSFNRQFDSAIIFYEKYKTIIEKKDTKELLLVNNEIAKCELGLDLKKEVFLPGILNENSFSKGSNGAVGEYSSALSPDKKTVIHTFKIPVDETRKFDESARYFENTKLQPADAENTSAPKQKKSNNGAGIDTILYSTTIGSSVDGQIILTYRNEKNEASLFISRLRKNKWSAPEKLKKTANREGWESNEYITSDGNTMYFVSERPGGYGGQDLYKCSRLPDGGWSKASNLGPGINSKFDDVAPFMHPDGKTFYFSSNRVKPGSFDIYTSTLAGKEWSKPENVGFPINRNDDDIFQVAADRKKVVITKPLEETKDKKKGKDTLKETETPEKQNFLVSVINQNKSPLTLLIGKVTDLTDKPVSNVKITVKDNVSGQLLGVFATDNKTGHYTMIMNPGKEHNLLYEAEGFLFRSENISITNEHKYFDRHLELLMQPIEKDASTRLNNLFFEKGKETLAAASALEMENLVNFLENYPQVMVEINHCIYAKENKKNNKKLAQSRAAEVVKQLAERGISKSRLSAEGTRMSKPPVDKKNKKADKKTEEKKQEVADTEVTELIIKSVN